MKPLALVLIVVVVLAVVFGGTLVSSRNEMVVDRESISASWAQVDVAIKRRADLIPNLVETVKGFAAQERALIDSVTQARASLLGARTPAESIKANSAMDSAIGRLLVVVENYPQIKSNENFLRLQDEIATSENKIAVERRKYNETVQKYNTNIALFPKNIAASLFGFSRNNEYFQTAPAEREAPKVKF